MNTAIATVADRCTDAGVLFALNSRAMFEAGPMRAVDMRGVICYVRVGGTDWPHTCGRAECCAGVHDADWAALDSAEAMPGHGKTLDLQTWLAFRAWQITREQCFLASLPDLTIDAETADDDEMPEPEGKHERELLPTELAAFDAMMNEATYGDSLTCLQVDRLDRDGGY